MEAAKTTVNILQPLAKALNDFAEECCLRRDLFLAKLIEGELEHLAQDMNGKVVSTTAHRHIRKALKQISIEGERLELIAFPLKLKKSTISRMHKIMKDHHIVRDSFLNRVLFLYFIGDKGLSTERYHPSETKLIPAQVISDLIQDPFFDLRNRVRESQQLGLYEAPILSPKYSIGLSCYLTDAEIEGSPAHTKAQRELQDLIDSL